MHAKNLNLDTLSFALKGNQLNHRVLAGRQIPKISLNLVEFMEFHENPGFSWKFTKMSGIPDFYKNAFWGEMPP